mmetsp:Transcript_39603/g.76969  ORF Transcript_39603/g.76969 Transcript_39603/m.76969 type:complete len:245 (+) Transcript_39603:3752-4486(+)
MSSAVRSSSPGKRTIGVIKLVCPAHMESPNSKRRPDVLMTSLRRRPLIGAGIGLGSKAPSKILATVAPAVILAHIARGRVGDARMWSSIKNGPRRESTLVLSRALRVLTLLWSAFRASCAVSRPRYASWHEAGRESRCLTEYHQSDSRERSGSQTSTRARLGPISSWRFVSSLSNARITPMQPSVASIDGSHGDLLGSKFPDLELSFDSESFFAVADTRTRSPTQGSAPVTLCSTVESCSCTTV